MRKMTTKELDLVLGKGWHKQGKLAGFTELLPELRKLGIKNPDFYVGRGGEIFLRDVDDAAKYLYTNLNVSMFK